MVGLPVQPPLPPMLARLERALPEHGHLYEPKWDGFRALAFRDGDWADLQSRNLNRFGRYFPELVEVLKTLPHRRLVLDGEIVIVGSGGFDFGALLKRVHPARSRVERLRAETPATFVAFDVLAADDRDLRSLPFVDRRAILERLLEGASRPLLLTPITEDVSLAAEWLDRFTGRGVDGVVAKARDLRYEAGKRSMVKVKPERTADCVVGGFRVADVGVTSLVLGLYDDHSVLRHVGVTSSFTRQDRTALLDKLRPHVVPLAGHPWEHGFAIERRPMGRLRGAAGLWTPEMPQDWVPVEPVLVCEVAYSQLDIDRFRHPAQFRRWRIDRSARSCTFEQLIAQSPAELVASRGRGSQQTLRNRREASQAPAATLSPE